MSDFTVESTDGVVVTVHDLGGDGDPFLICHATGFLGMVYAPMAARLTARHHVYALDFRGHGDTPAPANDRFDWGGMADDLDAVVGAITSEPIAVFGHSMGGAVAVLLERRTPGTLRSAYLYEPIIVPPGMGPPADNPMSGAARRRRPSFPSRGDVMLRYASRPPLNILQAGALAAYVEHGFADEPDGTVRLKCLPEHEAATFDATGKATTEEARDVRTPTVIGVGVDNGSWSPSLFGPSIVDAMPNARLERFPHLGHFGPMQDPGVIAEAILRNESA
jgi:pimeloyl-ACP methyl ester carboxylesterase